MALRPWSVELALALLVAIPTGGLRPAALQPVARLPMAITACGQTADALTVSLLSRRVHLDHLFDLALKPQALRGIRTLVVVIGGSVKGLGETGADDERLEVARVKALLGTARQLAVRVIAVHVGGESRRGAASDRLIAAVVDEADYLIVTEAGNRDGLFTRAARARTVPLVIVNEPGDVGRELKAAVTE